METFKINEFNLETLKIGKLQTSVKIAEFLNKNICC